MFSISTSARQRYRTFINRTSSKVRLSHPQLRNAPCPRRTLCVVAPPPSPVRPSAHTDSCPAVPFHSTSALRVPAVQAAMSAPGRESVSPALLSYWHHSTFFQGILPKLSRRIGCSSHRGVRHSRARRERLGGRLDEADMLGQHQGSRAHGVGCGIDAVGLAPL